MAVLVMPLLHKKEVVWNMVKCTAIVSTVGWADYVILEKRSSGTWSNSLQM